MTPVKVSRQIRGEIEPVQLKAALTSAVNRLTSEAVPSPRMNAELLLMFTLSCDRAYLFAHPERELTEEETARYDEALGHRARGVPAQYITGHQEFWGLDLIVGPAVLIPRPETEHLVETVVRLAKGILLEEGASDPRQIPPLADPTTPKPALRGPKHASVRDDASLTKIVDVGTGSGAIALALAKELPDAEIHATDVSPAALGSCRGECGSAPDGVADHVS